MLFTVDELYSEYGENSKFYKITSPDETYFGVKFYTGINMVESYIGSHFYHEDQLRFVLDFENNPFYIREVTFPDDILIDICNWNMRTNIFILGEKQLLSEFLSKNLKLLRKNGILLKYINPEHQTYDICLTCVTQSGLALAYVINKSYQLCMSAIKNDGMCLPYINKDFISEELLLETIKSSHGRTLSIIDDDMKTYNLCKQSIILSGINLQYVPKRFNLNDLLIEAVKINPYCFIFTDPKYHTLTLYEEIVKISPLLLSFITVQTQQICMLAVERDGMALEFVDKKYKSYDILKTAFSQNGLSIKHYHENIQSKESIELAKIAIQNNPASILYIKPQTYELSMLAVTKDGKMIKHIINPTPELCKIAMDGGAAWYDVKHILSINNNYITN